MGWTLATSGERAVSADDSLLSVGLCVPSMDTHVMAGYQPRQCCTECFPAPKILGAPSLPPLLNPWSPSCPQFCLSQAVTERASQWAAFPGWFLSLSRESSPGVFSWGLLQACPHVLAGLRTTPMPARATAGIHPPLTEERHGCSHVLALMSKATINTPMSGERTIPAPLGNINDWDA